VELTHGPGSSKDAAHLAASTWPLPAGYFVSSLLSPSLLYSSMMDMDGNWMGIFLLKIESRQ